MPSIRSKSVSAVEGCDGARPPPGTIIKRGSASSRARSVVATLVNVTAQVFQPSCPPAVKVSVEGSLDIAVKVTVQGAKAEGGGLPATCPAGKTSTATFLSSTVIRGAMTKGTITVEGFDPVPFAVAHNDQGTNFVNSKGRCRHTALAAPKWNWREHEEKPTEGKAADIEVMATRFADKAPHLKVQVRPATETELRRCLQFQALREAQEGEDYEALHAQVAKARMAGVEVEQIEKGEERLRELRKQRLHINEGCDKDSLGQAMVWAKVTPLVEVGVQNEPCTASPDCACNEKQNCGEDLQVVPGAVQLCLKDFGSEGDRLFFEELSASAQAVEEGSVWKAGGKFIFSAFDRNQSVSALTRTLNNAGRNRCAKMILQMVAFSEKEYGGYVTAIQVNFHPHGGTYHGQHRDIYSAKQRAGPNCTCTFKKCVGTVCYTVGSSRVCLLETMTDEMSALRPCGETCTGRRERCLLNSGDAMFFNEAWNANHTHGIPAMEDGESHGPRISVAFLLGAEDSRVNLYAMPNTIP
mmetsp:Transcript_48029/g.86390  ORF Transcript_48029/g.86390 Transcript_48029/m.86390 type:complete len:526 (-) Transcript_48029:359-1936(-)